MRRAVFLTSALMFCSVWLGGCTSVPRGLEPVADFNAERYLGKWYEIARLDHRFERNLSNVTAQYSWRDAGGIDVVNRGYNTKTGEWQEATAVARFRQDPDIASLRVSFQWPFYGGYHVIALDENYKWAMVTGNNRSYLWILSREPTLDPAIQERLIEQADEWGFETEELIFVSHRPPTP